MCLSEGDSIPDRVDPLARSEEDAPEEVAAELRTAFGD